MCWVDLSVGTFVFALVADGIRYPAVVVGEPQRHGEFDCVVLADLADWEEHPAGGTPGGDWQAWKYHWPIEALAEVGDLTLEQLRSWPNQGHRRGRGADQ